jgi:hypothetical protein
MEIQDGSLVSSGQERGLRWCVTPWGEKAPSQDREREAKEAWEGSCHSEGGKSSEDKTLMRWASWEELQGQSQTDRKA